MLAHNRIQAARDYCRRLPHPNAHLWLAEIDERFPIHASDDLPSPYGPFSDGEISPEFRDELDWPLEWVDVQILDKEKNQLQSTINLREWLGCIGFYVGAMVFFSLIYAAALVVIYHFVGA